MNVIDMQKVTVKDFQKMKDNGEKITMLTAYNISGRLAGNDSVRLS